MSTKTEAEVEKENSALLNEDEMVEGASYVTPSIEFQLSKEKRQACRDILLEIRNFGISQRQTLFLIQLLALELEDMAITKELMAVIGAKRETVPLTKEEDHFHLKTKKKLILGD